MLCSNWLLLLVQYCLGKPSIRIFYKLETLFYLWFCKMCGNEIFCFMFDTINMIILDLSCIFWELPSWYVMSMSVVKRKFSSLDEQRRISRRLSRLVFRMLLKILKEPLWTSGRERPSVQGMGWYVICVQTPLLFFMCRCVTRTSSYSSDRDSGPVRQSPGDSSSPNLDSGGFEGSERERLFETGTQVTWSFKFANYQVYYSSVHFL